MHNKIVKKCTTYVEKIKKICYSIDRGELNETNKKRLYAKINR